MRLRGLPGRGTADGNHDDLVVLPPALLREATARDIGSEVTDQGPSKEALTVELDYAWNDGFFIDKNKPDSENEDQFAELLPDEVVSAFAELRAKAKANADEYLRLSDLYREEVLEKRRLQAEVEILTESQPKFRDGIPIIQDEVNDMMDWCDGLLARCKVLHAENDALRKHVERLLKTSAWCDYNEQSLTHAASSGHGEIRARAKAISEARQALAQQKDDNG